MIHKLYLLQIKNNAAAFCFEVDELLQFCRKSCLDSPTHGEDIESGKFTLLQVRRIYDIGGGNTVYPWLRKLGKGHLIERIVRIEMKDEKDKHKGLQHKNQELQSALVQTQLKLLVYESLLESAEAHYQVDVKKLLVRRRQAGAP